MKARVGPVGAFPEHRSRVVRKVMQDPGRAKRCGREGKSVMDAATGAGAGPQAGRRTGIRALALGLLCLLPTLSLAQSIPPSTNGVQMGSGRLHAWFDLETRFDSAAGFFPETGATGAPLTLQGELLWFLRPGLRLELPGDAFDFSVGGNVEYVAYSGFFTPGSSAANRLQAAADLALTLNESGVVEVQLTDAFRRNDRTTNAAVGFGVLALTNTVGLKVPVRPGGGALEIVPGAEFTIEYLSPLSSEAGTCADASCDPAAVSEFDSQRYGGSLAVRWNFLPRTTLILDNTFGQSVYPNGQTPSTSLFQSTLGIAGLITQKLSLNAKAGWAQNFGELGGATVVGQAELSLPPTPMSMASAGYLRSLRPMSLYGTVINDRVYANGRMLMGGKLSLMAEAGFNWLHFQGDSGRDDTLLNVSLMPEYEVLPWFLVGGGYQLEVRGSNTGFASLNLARHEVMLRLTVRY